MSAAHKDVSVREFFEWIKGRARDGVAPAAMMDEVMVRAGVLGVGLEYRICGGVNMITFAGTNVGIQHDGSEWLSRREATAAD
jgi:hypothetical protein